MTRDEAVAAARQYCEAPANLVWVAEDDAWLIAEGEQGLPAYGLPLPPYWVVPLHRRGIRAVGASTVVVVSDTLAPIVVTYGE